MVLWLTWKPVILLVGPCRVLCANGAAEVLVARLISGGMFLSLIGSGLVPQSAVVGRGDLGLLM